MTSMSDSLNPDQQSAVDHNQGPLLIIAGAGSGKTRALIHRAAKLIKSGTPPNQILLVTFTNKAAEEMQTRLMSLIGTRLPYAGTFHSFCAKLLRHEGHHVGISPNFVINDEADSISAIKAVIKKLDLDPKQYNPRSIRYSISSAKNELISAEEYAQFARGPFQKVVAQVYAHYQKLLATSHALDFDDLLFNSVKLLKTVPMVREKYQKHFTHILVDEYQDTNKAQYELTKELAKVHGNLTVVGDASQSIYRFRGADYRNLQYLKSDFPNITTIELSQNYRSTQNILDAAHGVISNNTSHPVLKLWTQAQSGSGLTTYEANSEYDEANYVLNQILDKQVETGFPLNSFAILYRTNAQSRPLEEIFIKAGVPYQLVGGVEFYQRKEVKDVLAYLRLVLNPNDQISLNRVLKIGKRRYQQFILWLDKTDPQNSPLDLLEGVLSSTKYLDLFDDKVEEDFARIENIKELKSVAAQFEKLSDFLESVALVQDKSLPGGKGDNRNQDAVTFMTLHASKGLEFNTIFLVGMEEGLFPHSRSMLDKEEMEEERRLCYVGITRAKQKLFLTHAKQRLYFGSRSSSTPSRFLSEIPLQVFSGETRSLTKSQSSQIDDLLSGDLDIDDFLNS